MVSLPAASLWQAGVGAVLDSHAEHGNQLKPVAYTRLLPLWRDAIVVN